MIPYRNHKNERLTSDMAMCRVGCFLLMYTMLSTAVPSAPIKIRQELFEQHQDTRSTGRLLSESSARSKVECTVMCLDYSGCRDCNYDVATKKCELLQAENSTVQTGTYTMSKPVGKFTRFDED